MKAHFPGMPFQEYETEYEEDDIFVLEDETALEATDEDDGEGPAGDETVGWPDLSLWWTSLR